MNEYEIDLNAPREIELELDTRGGDGATFVPTVSSAGVISWSNNKNLPNPDPVNIKGPQGETGETGPEGAVFTPTVSSAGVISWSNDGGKPNPSPVNIKGPQGEQGQQGQTGPAGSDGNNGATFTPTVSTAGVISWTNDGGLPNPSSVNIKGPQGQTGPAGQGVPTGGTTGQVLKKKSGTNYDTEWGDVSGGGGSGLRVNCTKNGDTITADKTYADILAAYNNGTNVYLVVNYSLFYLFYSVSSSNISFSHPTYDTATGQYYYTDAIVFNSNGTITTNRLYFDALTLTTLPTYLAGVGLNPWQVEFLFYYESGTMEFSSYYVPNGNVLDFFDNADYTRQAFLAVENQDAGCVDTFHSSKIWTAYEGENDDEFVGHILFSRSWVSTSPNEIIIDEVEMTWNETTDEFSIIGSNSAVVSASSVNPVY